MAQQLGKRTSVTTPELSARREKWRRARLGAPACFVRVRKGDSRPVEWTPPAQKIMASVFDTLAPSKLDVDKEQGGSRPPTSLPLRLRC